MKKRKEPVMRTDQAKSIHIRDLLTSLGHEPSRQVRGEWWYCSPLRQEAEASFKISADGKAWYDHGTGLGGNILKFVCVYYGLPASDVSGALRKLDDLHIVRSTSLGNPSVPSSQPSLWENAHQSTINARREAKAVSDREGHPKEEADALTIVKIVPLQSLALIAYLKGRGIDQATARPWVQEMHYQRGDKPYYSLAFASRSGGYELRGRGFKSAQGKKDISILNEDSRAGECAAFEGFIDFLSWMQHRGITKPDMPVVILNSVGLRKRAVEAIQAIGIHKVHLYADHDESGHALVEYMTTHLADIEVIDASHLYSSFHDYNDFLTHTRNRKAACIS